MNILRSSNVHCFGFILQKFSDMGLGGDEEDDESDDEGIDNTIV